MRTVRAVAIACFLIFPVLASAAQDIPDSTGSYRVNAKGDVVVQTVISAKLPVDTLMVVFKDGTREPVAFPANLNVMVIHGTRMFSQPYILARYPREVRWHRTMFRRQVEWTARRPYTRVFLLPAEVVESIRYHSTSGQQWGITPQEPENVRPGYWPSRIPTEAELQKKKDKK